MLGKSSSAVAGTLCAHCQVYVGSRHLVGCPMYPQVCGHERNDSVPANRPDPLRCRNRKTGNVYLYLGEGVDCTNRRDGTRVAHYVDERTPNAMPYVRELSEFWTKFEPV